MIPPRLLVVDDEEQIRRFLHIALRAAGYTVEGVATGRAAIAACANNGPALMLLDLGLGDIDGVDVIRAVRQHSLVPIIVLSVRSDEEDKVAALDAGANDYIQKPFGTAELLARVRAALRSSQRSEDRKVYSIGDLHVDVARHEVTVSGRPVRLSPKEFGLLVVLARNSGCVVTHRQLLEEVWGTSHADDIQYLRVYIGQLREKLGDDAAAPWLIANEPGIGYRLLDSQTDGYSPAGPVADV